MVFILTNMGLCFITRVTLSPKHLWLDVLNLFVFNAAFALAKAKYGFGINLSLVIILILFTGCSPFLSSDPYVW